jgi:YbgC/YbaW family acyl-CoA thioester hydrolase
MRAFETIRTIEWGDCDAAGIVYYPNYYRWMDAAFHAMTAALGFDQRTLAGDHGLLGTPLVDTRCAFAAPASYGDSLSITATVVALGATSLRVAYGFARGGTTIATGEEARVFVRRDGERIVKTPIPDPVRSALERALTPATCR